MTMRSALLGAAASLLVAGTAAAGDVGPTGWYTSLGAGLNWIKDGGYQTYESGSTYPGIFSYERGYIVSGAVGYDFGRNWRVEFEAAYRDNDIGFDCDAFSLCGPVNADVWEFSQMFNVLYDVPVNERWEVAVGAGVGGNLVVVGDYDVREMDDYVFAVQGIAEVAYRMSDRWKLFADYRYMTMGDPGFAFASTPGARLELEKGDTSLLMGVRFDLQRDAAPKVIEPEVQKPVAEAPKQFIVFFGFNKANLTAEAVRVVAEASEAAKKNGSASLAIVGHTDTSGSTDYNLALSMRRSQAVKDSLIAHGIDGSMISTAGRGEAELLVNTGDGVKEPQNRRATIDLK